MYRVDDIPEALVVALLLGLAGCADKSNDGERGDESSQGSESVGSGGATADPTGSGTATTSDTGTGSDPGETGGTETGDSGSTGAAEAPQPCIDAITLPPGDERDSAESECAEALEDYCGPLRQGACEDASSLPIPETDTAIRCLWHDTWTGVADGGCDRGVESARCMGALYVGDGGVGGPYFRASGSLEIEVVSNHSVESPFDYTSCNTADEPPAACECLEP